MKIVIFWVVVPLFFFEIKCFEGAAVRAPKCFSQERSWATWHNIVYRRKCTVLLKAVFSFSRSGVHFVPFLVPSDRAKIHINIYNIYIHLWVRARAKNIPEQIATIWSISQKKISSVTRFVWDGRFPVFNRACVRARSNSRALHYRTIHSLEWGLQIGGVFYYHQ